MKSHHRTTFEKILVDFGQDKSRRQFEVLFLGFELGQFWREFVMQYGAILVGRSGNKSEDLWACGEGIGQASCMGIWAVHDEISWLMICSMPYEVWKLFFDVLNVFDVEMRTFPIDVVLAK